MSPSSFVAIRGVSIVFRASPAVDRDVDSHIVAGYSLVDHKVVVRVVDHEVVVRVADHEVVYHVVDHEVVDHTADHEIADRLVDNEVSDSDHKITDHPVDMRLLILLLMAELTMPVVIVV